MPTADGSHASHEKFYEYYAKASQTDATLRRFASIRDATLRLYQAHNPGHGALDVADIGCGAGTQSLMWASLGHRVHGLDINEPLIALGRERARAAGAEIEFNIGTATALPWPSASMDVCLLPELIEHVAEWRACLSEAVRILRPYGILYLSTTNRLCPKQQEFSLPFYSWYPARLKRYYERQSVTTRPELVNFAKYPAVNWFTFYELRAVLVPMGFRCFDRFDIIDLSRRGARTRAVVKSIQAVPLLRWLGHVATPSLTLVAVKLG
jgi:2-polyprenyl-6-hydroxyphenyl methylase/3-demethylubiquinone-9 3-methyltransferase